MKGVLNFFHSVKHLKSRICLNVQILFCNKEIKWIEKKKKESIVL